MPPLTVGQKVAQGEQIGRVGNSGTVENHLHYSQLADGSAVRIAFNGTLINTHAGNLSSSRHLGQRRKAHERELPDELVPNVDRINAAGNGASTIWSGSWGKGWTHLAPFVQGGVQYFLAYQGGTGAVEVDKITGSGNSVTITEVWSSTGARDGRTSFRSLTTERCIC